MEQIRLGVGDGEALLVSTSLQMAPKSWQGASAVVLVMERVGRPAVPPEKKKKKKRRSRDSEKAGKAGLLK